MRKQKMEPKTPSPQIYGKGLFPKEELGSLSAGSESLCHVSEGMCVGSRGILSGQQVMPRKVRR